MIFVLIVSNGGEKSVLTSDNGWYIILEQLITKIKYSIHGISYHPLPRGFFLVFLIQHNTVVVQLIYV